MAKREIKEKNRPRDEIGTCGNSAGQHFRKFPKYPRSTPNLGLINPSFLLLHHHGSIARIRLSLPITSLHSNLSNPFSFGRQEVFWTLTDNDDRFVRLLTAKQCVQSMITSLKSYCKHNKSYKQRPETSILMILARPPYTFAIKNEWSPFIKR